MKRTIIIIAAVLCLGIAASAQPKAIGARLGVGYGPVALSYEHYLGGINFAEANLGVYTAFEQVGFIAEAIYNWVLYEPEWTPRGEWAWYAGPGISFGSVPYSRVENPAAMYGIVGQVGLEYTFWFPLQLSADVRPRLCYVGDSLWEHGLSHGFIPTISVRYHF